MAIAVDATTPARWAGTPSNGGTIVSASFTPPANSFLVCAVCSDGSSGNGTVSAVVTTSGLTWTKQVERTWTETTDGGQSAWWTCPQVSSASRTITVTFNFTSGTTLRISAKAYVLTGVDIAGTPVDTVGANNEGGSGTNNLTTTSITPGANGVICGAGTDWNALGAATSSDLTLASGPDHAEYAGAIDVICGLKACTNGVSVNGNLDAAGTGTAQWKWCQIIVREAATSTDTGEWMTRSMAMSAPNVVQIMY